jgi:hypothetical protein
MRCAIALTKNHIIIPSVLCWGFISVPARGWSRNEGSSNLLNQFCVIIINLNYESVLKDSDDGMLQLALLGFWTSPSLGIPNRKTKWSRF